MSLFDLSAIPKIKPSKKRKYIEGDKVNIEDLINSGVTIVVTKYILDIKSKYDGKYSIIQFFYAEDRKQKLYFFETSGKVLSAQIKEMRADGHDTFIAKIEKYKKYYKFVEPKTEDDEDEEIDGILQIKFL